MESAVRRHAGDGGTCGAAMLCCPADHTILLPFTIECWVHIMPIRLTTGLDFARTCDCVIDLDGGGEEGMLRSTACV